MIPPAECLVEPAKREAVPAPEMPPLMTLDARNPLPHWQSRATRAELFGTFLLNRADAVETDNKDRDAVSSRCAEWARRVAEEQTQ